MGKIKKLPIPNTKKRRRRYIEDEENPRMPLDDGGEEFLNKLSKQSI